MPARNQASSRFWPTSGRSSAPARPREERDERSIVLREPTAREHTDEVRRHLCEVSASAERGRRKARQRARRLLGSPAQVANLAPERCERRSIARELGDRAQPGEGLDLALGSELLDRRVVLLREESRLRELPELEAEPDSGRRSLGSRGGHLRERALVLRVSALLLRIGEEPLRQSEHLVEKREIASFVIRKPSVRGARRVEQLDELTEILLPELLDAFDDRRGPKRRPHRLVEIDGTESTRIEHRDGDLGTRTQRTTCDSVVLGRATHREDARIRVERISVELGCASRDRVPRRLVRTPRLRSGTTRRDRDERETHQAGELRLTHSRISSQGLSGFVPTLASGRVETSHLEAFLIRILIFLGTYRPIT